MYFRENDKPVEGYTHNKTVEKFSPFGKDGKFPAWLLFVIIGTIVVFGLFMIFRLKHGKKSQNFGFRFY